MDKENARPAQHPIITGEHSCNDHIPPDRLQAYFKDRPKLTLKSPKVKDWSKQNENKN